MKLFIIMRMIYDLHPENCNCELIGVYDNEIIAEQILAENDNNFMDYLILNETRDLNDTN